MKDLTEDEKVDRLPIIISEQFLSAHKLPSGTGPSMADVGLMIEVLSERGVKRIV